MTKQLRAWNRKNCRISRSAEVVDTTNARRNFRYWIPTLRNFFSSFQPISGHRLPFRKKLNQEKQNINTFSEHKLFKRIFFIQFTDRFDSLNLPYGPFCEKFISGTYEVYKITNIIIITFECLKITVNIVSRILFQKPWASLSRRFCNGYKMTIIF